MAVPEPITTWAFKRDEIRRRLAALRPVLAHSGRLRAAPGEVVAPGGVAATVVARQAFLRIAGAVAPQLLVELARAPLDEYAAHWDALGGPRSADPTVDRDLELELLSQFVEMVLEEETETGEWIGTWGFPAGTDWEEYFETEDVDAEAALRRAAVVGWGLTMAVHTLHCWRAHPLPAVDPPGLVDAFATWSGLEDGDLGLESPLALPTPRWNPQREERGKAADRIQGELQAAVRGELDRISERARSVGAPRPKVTELAHFVWLARYQFRRESYPTIADAAGRQRQSVTPAVQAAAELVGMPLRRPNPPGRPRKVVPPPPIRPRRPDPRPTIVPVRSTEPGQQREPSLLPVQNGTFDRAEPAGD